MFKLYFIIFVLIPFFIVRESNCDVRDITISYQGKDYNFNVDVLKNKAFHNVPVWTIQSNLNNESEFNYEGIVNTNGVLYEDTAMKAILVEKNNCTSNCWEGAFGLGTKRRAISIKPEQELLTNDYYSLFNISGVYRTYSIKLNVSEEKRKSRKYKVAESNNNAYYPKLLIIIDGALFKKLNNDVEFATRYLSIFWSEVDLQYRNITSPKIEIRIMGLIIAKDDKALNYISKNSPDGKSVNIEDVLLDSRNEKDFIKNTNISNYDAVITMTGLDGYTEVGPHRVKVGSSGVSWNGTLCMDDYYFSVTSDDGKYLGIHSAIHEIGHLLGLDHDAVPGNAWDCFPTNRKYLTVMWPRFEDRENEIWSECSLRALQIFSEDKTLSGCCRKDPHQ